MKLVFLSLLLTIFFLGGMLLRAEDWTTIDGKVYHQIKVIKVEPDAVTILYEDGGALVPLIMLPQELQKKFNYDAATAKAAADARQQADLENARALRAEYWQAVAQKQAKLAAEESASESTQTVGDTQVSYADPSHHSRGELFDATQRLMNGVSYDTHHYSMGYLVAQPYSAGAAGAANHYSMDGPFGSGDPLSH